MKNFKVLKKYWNFFFSILIIALLIPLLSESLEKVLVITAIIIVWNILGIILKDFIKSSFLTLLLILSFNITYQLPCSVFGIQLADPYVNGIIVNYLIPTISILDLGVFLLLISMCSQRKIDLKWKGFSFIKIFLILGIYLIIQSVLKSSFLSFFNSIRLLLYVFTFYNLLKNLKEIFDKKMYSRILIGSILLVIFQGILALLQFSGGSSVGLSFLGESQVVNGMVGSSFLELSGALYLRGYGALPHPNIFSGWLIFNILLGWYLFDNMQRRRDYSIVLMAISSIVLILTFSRISFLVCGIIWLSFVVKVFVNAKNKNFVFLGLISERVLNLFTNGDTSWNDRVNLMRTSLVMIKENILTGVGLGNFTSSMEENIPRSDKGILLLQPVHNIFLLIVSEIGLVGTGLFSTLLYFFFKNRKWSLRFVMCLASIFIIGTFDHYLFSLPQGLGLFFLLIVI